MRVIRIFWSAAALAAVLVGGAGSAAAAVGPQATQTSVSGVRISCTGDTVPGRVEVVTSAPVDVLVTLQTQESRGFVSTDRTATIHAVPGTRSYSFDLNVAGLPVTVLEYRVLVVAGSEHVVSNAVSARRCAPDAVVPEVPSAVLLPVSLSCTAMVVFAVRRRRGVRPA